MLRSSLCLFVLLVVECATIAGDSDAELPPKLKTVLETAARAHAQGDAEAVWHALVPHVIRAKPEVLEAFNRELDDHKLPPVGELLAEARLKLVMQGRAAALPVPDLHERLLLLPALGENVKLALKKMEEHPVIAGKAAVPVNLEEFQRRFEEIERLFEILGTAEVSAAYGLDVADKIPSASKKKLTAEEQESVAACNQDVLDSVRDAQRNLYELQLETNLERLAYGLKALEKPELTKERFMVAASTQFDANTVLRQLELRAGPIGSAPSGSGAAGSGAIGSPASGSAAAPATDRTRQAGSTGTTSSHSGATPVKKSPAPKGGTNSKSQAKGGKKIVAAPPPPPPPAFRRAALTRDGLADEVRTQKEKAAKLAGPLAEKSTWFFEGLHWWVRGRYGAGPDVNGLVKSSGAKDNPILMLHVQMPKELPSVLAVGNSARHAITHADRRHHYTWAWEDRKLVTSLVAGKKGEIRSWGHSYMPGSTHINTPDGWNPNANSSDKIESVTAVRTVQLPAQDPLLVYRIVGFVEYERAVASFDRFVQEATILEFEIAEQIVRDRDFLTVETNLSRKLELAAGPLSERSMNPRDDYQRQGLAWMLAVARVELGAMLAGFTFHADPFSVFAPKMFKPERVKTAPFGSLEYSEVLLDGLRTHYCALMHDPAVQSYYKNGVPEEHLVTHSRRAILGQALLRAVRERMETGVSDEATGAGRTAELNRWEQAFQKLHRVMLYCLSKKTGTDRTVVYERLVCAIELGNGGREQAIGGGVQTDRSPDVITRWLETIDPTLVGCPCR